MGPAGCEKRPGAEYNLGAAGNADLEVRLLGLLGYFAQGRSFNRCARQQAAQ
jgi:hypothetical protein